MDQIIIDKYKSNPAWSEIVKIYSDLFDDSNQRNSFINEIGEIDTFIAAQCITSSFQTDLALEDEIIAKAELKLKEFKINGIIEPSAYYAMIELQKSENILGLFSNCKSNQLPFLKSSIQYLLDSNKNKSSIIVEEVIECNPSCYLKAINDYYFSANDLLDETTYKNISKKILIDPSIKPTHIINFLRLRIDVDLFIEEEILNAFLSRISDYNDIVFFISKFNVTFDLKNYLSKKTASSISIKECFMIFNLIRGNEQSYKHEIISFIEKIIKNTDQNLQILALILIIYYKKTNQFRSSLTTDQMATLLFLSTYDFEKFNDIDFFYSAIHTIKQKRTENISENKISSYYGKKIKTKVLSKWRYHYILNKIDDIGKPILLPFQETSELINIDDEINVIIIYVDKENQRLYASQRQINQEIKQLYFDRRHINTIKIGDSIICKVEYIRNDIKNGIRLTPKGGGNGSIRCILDKSFQNIERLAKVEEFTVKKIINPSLVIVSQV